MGSLDALLLHFPYHSDQTNPTLILLNSLTHKHLCIPQLASFRNFHFRMEGRAPSRPSPLFGAGLPTAPSLMTARPALSLSKGLQDASSRIVSGFSRQRGSVAIGGLGTAGHRRRPPTLITSKLPSPNFAAPYLDFPKRQAMFGSFSFVGQAARLAPPSLIPPSVVGQAARLAGSSFPSVHRRRAPDCRPTGPVGVVPSPHCTPTAQPARLAFARAITRRNGFFGTVLVETGIADAMGPLGILPSIGQD